MKLNLTINGAAREIEIIASPPHCRFHWNSSVRSAEVESVGPGVYSILLDGRSYDARVERAGTATVIVIGGYRFEVEVLDPRRWSPKSALAAHGVANLSAPMPGRVVRVLVALGEIVEAGKVILVVEAMKMQNEMKAPRAGRVASLRAVEGATVTAGEILASIE